MQNLELNPKNDIVIDDWNLSRVESIITNWEEPHEYWEYFPTGMLVANGNALSKTIQKYKWFRKYKSSSKACKLVMALVLKSIAIRLQR